MSSSWIKSGAGDDERAGGVLVKIFTIIAFMIFTLTFAGASHALCSFRSTPTAMNFGNLSPANNTDATATSTVSIRCTAGPNPYPFTMSDDNGRYSTAPGQHRMRNTVNTAQYLPYAFTYTTSGTIPRNTNVTFTFSGTVAAIDYQNAWVGSYSDAVTVTINP